MSKQSLSTLKSWFEDGQRPTGDQFSDVFDSFLHLDPSYDLTAPGASGVVATQEYVSNLIDGLDYKQDAFCSTTANITLSGIQNLDGTTGAADVRVLVQHQTTATQNGIYLMKSGSWVRTTDADTGLKLQWAVVQVANGTLYGSKVFRCAVASITLGSTNIVWTEWSLASYTAGSGLSLTGNQFAVDSTVVRTSGAQSIAGFKTYSDGTSQKEIKILKLGGNAAVSTDYLAAMSSAIANRLDLGLGFSAGVSAGNFVCTNFEATNIYGLGSGSNQLNIVHGNNSNGVIIKKNTIVSQSTLVYFLSIGYQSEIRCTSNAVVEVIKAEPVINNSSGTITVTNFHAAPVQTAMNSGGKMYGFRSQINAGFASGAGTAYALYFEGTAPSYMKAKLTLDDDVEITDYTKGLILKSPDGTRWRISVNNSGILTATSI